MNRFFYVLSILVLFLVARVLPADGNPAFNGNWSLVPQNSTEIDLYNSLRLEIALDQHKVSIIQTWGGNRGFSDSLFYHTDGQKSTNPVPNRVFPTNVFMGLSRKTGTVREATAAWQDDNTLVVTEATTVLASQGATRLDAVHTYELLPEEGIIFYRIDRTSRPDDPGIRYTLKRSGTKEAHYLALKDDWAIEGALPTQAFLITLQGLANAQAPNLYFVYPEKWDFRFTPDVLDFLRNERYYTFHKLSTAEQALEKFAKHVQGYIVWDKDVRTSLIVSFTVAGLERAVVITDDMIPMMQKHDIPLVRDFRGQFTGQSDAEIYRWAIDEYWDRCSKEYIVWMGGEHGRIMKPGVADWGIYKRAFFNDLSTKESDTEEYALANELLADMKPLSLVFGWHSYKKDKERDHVKLTSNYALRVEGLHTLPNMSFSSQVPASPGFEFKNNHNIEPGAVYTPEDKVYVACIQTDCLGLGAWTRPGRGQIPYAWEVTMNWVWLAPAMMEYFYTQATPNDYFIGSLSGPGYMYPKAIPDKWLPELIEIARELMHKLDLNVFEIMDYSEGATVEGNTELTKKVVEAYYQGMPDVIGFANGYAPSFTFAIENGRPLISYDYYLSPSRPETDAIADLKELAQINEKRPYFLLMHVRQWSDITRVKSILDRLGPEFEVVPLDIFMKMAGQEPTFEERFLERE